MNPKIIILAFIACYQVTMAQRPTGLPLPFGTGSPFGGFGNGVGGLGGGFGGGLGAFNNNWVRPYYTAAAEGWRTYFDQLQQARTQLYQTLTNLQNTAQNATGAARDAITQILSAIPVHTKQAHDDERPILGDLTAPTVEAPAHDVPQEVHILQTVSRPQGVQSDVPKVRPPQQQQVTVTHTVNQAQPNSRQPATVTHQVTATRPVATGTVTSGVVPQVSSGVVPQVSSGIVSQVSSGVVPQVGADIVPQFGIPQVGSQLPSWVGK